MLLDVAIVGGGAAGTLVATHILKRNPRAKIAICEPSPELGKGIAYGTERMEHRLNVRAKGMSGDPDQMSDFVDWLRENGHDAHPESFAPRPLYGRYLNDRLRQTGQVTHIRAKATSLEPGFDLKVGDKTLNAKAVVVATGNRPPTIPSGLRSCANSTRFLADPWKSDLSQIGPQDEVLIVGSGLTMIDLVLELIATGHRGPIRVVSRRGLTPHRHEAITPASFKLDPQQSVRQWLKAIRTEAETQPWRGVIDGLRAQTPELWSSLSASDQRRFLRHLVPYWDAHRHRVDPDVWERAQSADLTQEAGWIVSAEPEFKVQVRKRWGGDLALEPRWILLANGPTWDAAEPLLPSAKVNRFGQVEGHPGLFAMGQLLKASAWETTAIPEIRVQAARIAESITSAMSAATA